MYRLAVLPCRRIVRSFVRDARRPCQHALLQTCRLSTCIKHCDPVVDPHLCKVIRCGRMLCFAPRKHGLLRSLNSITPFVIAAQQKKHARCIHAGSVSKAHSTTRDKDHIQREATCNGVGKALALESHLERKILVPHTGAVENTQAMQYGETIAKSDRPDKAHTVNQTAPHMEFSAYRKSSSQASMGEWSSRRDQYNSSSRRKAAGAEAPYPTAYLRSRHRKKDLSYVNVRKEEARIRVKTQHTNQQQPARFRANTGLRYLVDEFLRRLSSILLSEPISRLSPNSRQFDSALKRVFGSNNRRMLRDRGYRPEDLMSWAWVLSSQHGTDQAKRYAALCTKNSELNRSMPPFFLCLEILRADRIDAVSLNSLWTQGITALKTQTEGAAPNYDITEVFLIRLLRHARLVDVYLIRRIIAQVPHLFPQMEDTGSDVTCIKQRQRLTHFYNRLLSIITRPAPGLPFQAVQVQQIAQLTLAQHMFDRKPPIPINREGYRAFVALQLRHEKTNDEKDWARAKGPSWPPWRRDQLGIQEKIDYTGRFSRAKKVLQRMTEAGYAHDLPEDAASILAGWDTDGSPTIQMKKVLHPPPMAWLRSWRDKDNGIPAIADAGIWAARVAATRSIREAWLCFYSYMQATTSVERKEVVYHAMFDKLLASSHDPDSLADTLPGDGPQVWPDPASSRDLPYVPREPPSADELYNQMRDDGMRPAGRLLANLVQSAPSITQSLSYIDDSSLGEVKKDVLLHAEKYPASFIRDTIANIPSYLFASFISRCVRVENDPAVPAFAYPCSLSAFSGTRNLTTKNNAVSSFTYALELLQISDTIYLPPYNAVLACLGRRAEGLSWSQEDTKDLSYRRLQVWGTAHRLLHQMKENRVTPNMSTVRALASIVSAVDHFVPCALHSASSTSAPRTNLPEMFKACLQQALTGTDTLQLHDSPTHEWPKFSLPPVASLPQHRLPRAKDLRFMLLHWAAFNDISAVLVLLEWMHDGRRFFGFESDNESDFQQIMVSVRLALEPSWLYDEHARPMNVRAASSEEIRQAIEWSRPLMWATDEEVEDFLLRSTAWARKARRVLERQNHRDK